MKIYKAFFRFDYPISFFLVDRLGEQLDLIHQHTSASPYCNIENKIDVPGHSISAKGSLNKDKFILNLSLTTFNGSIEFDGGAELDKLNKCLLFDLADKVIEKLQVKKFDRVGVRVLSIEKQDEFQFDEILNYILRRTQPIGKSISSQFEINDIGLTFESIFENKECMRVILGPYKSQEKIRYFAIDPNIKEGLMMDVDIWEQKLAIPALKLSEIVKKSQRKFDQIISNISNEMLMELKNVDV